MQNKKDMFGIEYQYNNWSNTKTSFPIMFLNFNDVLTRKNDIDQFIGKQLNYDLFEIRERSSTEIQCPPKFKKIYENLKEKIYN
jgi:hypothetical protein